MPPSAADWRSNEETLLMARWRDLDEDENEDDFEDEDEEFEEADEAGDDTVPCPYCKEAIPEDAPRCPYCEQYISAEDEGRSSSRPLWFVVAVLVCLVIVFLWIV
jgi:predicted nucleic acid-binding Zn ribbon protein